MSRKSIVAVLSYYKDTTSTDVIASLKRRGQRALLLDSGDFPTAIQLNTTLHSGTKWQGTLSVDQETLFLEEIKSILYRRPTHYRMPSLPAEQLTSFADNEAVKGFGGILRSLNCFWISGIDAIRTANFKPLQLQRASELGMRIPKTLITNTPAGARAFYQECQGKIIYKPLHGGNISVDGELYDAIYTSLVLPEHLAFIEKRVPITANLFQEYIEKEFELRITVVGDRVFPAAIYSQHAEESRVDFRASYGSLEYAIYQLPEVVEKFCVALVRSFGLVYGAIDMAVTPSGEFVFFEINPAGQYQWIEYATHMPITETLVDLLLVGTSENTISREVWGDDGRE